MPELPEVETIKRSLNSKLKDVKIEKCEVFYVGSLKSHSAEKFINEVTGEKIVEVDRRGKYLKIILENERIILVHLRMTGRLLLTAADDHITKHTHVIFYLNNGLHLRFIDIRKFGTLNLASKGELNNIRGYAILGPEPFGEDFTLEGFKETVIRRKKAIKDLLLSQEVVAGIGNIYADEILYSAGISPLRPANSLNDEELERLFHSIRVELEKGIANRGTSFKDYVDADGISGNNQDFLNVYQKAGCSCNNCGCKVVKSKIGGRSSHYCTGCQK